MNKAKSPVNETLDESNHDSSKAPAHESSNASFNASTNYRTRIVSALSEIGQAQWDALVQAQADTNPFLSLAFLNALHESGSASGKSGWQPQFLTIWRADDDKASGDLVAALPLYVKSHSYGEYVFDWAWADAYERNGLEYYPKLLSAIPFLSLIHI